MIRRTSVARGMLAGLLTLLPLVAVAQPATQSATQPAGQVSGGTGMDMGAQAQGQPAQMDKMDKMAEAMTAMAQTCQTMMQNEHETLRYVVIGGSVIGVLLLIALILFIILEIQWIRFFGVKIKSEQRKLS